MDHLAEGLLAGGPRGRQPPRVGTFSVVYGIMALETWLLNHKDKEIISKINMVIY